MHSLLSEFEQKPFIELVGKILTVKEKNEDSTIFEAKIGNLIYEIYGLSEEEIEFIISQ
jgi:hypothetical protein